jgi:hypothetical protein
MARWQMVEDTAEALRAEIDHLRRLRQLVTDARVRDEIQKMIEELERRLREMEGRPPPSTLSERGHSSVRLRASVGKNESLARPVSLNSGRDSDGPTHRLRTAIFACLRSDEALLLHVSAEECGNATLRSRNNLQ